MKVYEYNKCSTCKKAIKFLQQKGLSFQTIPIVEQPPSLAELELMLSYVKSRGGSLRSLFNTSGIQYKEMSLSAKLPAMSESEALKLLSKNGKLIKRPFVLTKNGGLVGFKEQEWNEIL